MKVLHLVKNTVTRYGVAAVLHGLTSGLAAKGVESCVWTEEQGIEGGRLANGQRCVSGRLPHSGWLGLGRNLRNLKGFCEAEGFDVVHAHGVFRAGYAASLLRRHAGLPYVVTSHSDVNPDLYPKINRPSVRRRAVAALSGASAVTCLNEPMRGYTLRLLDVAAKCTIIPNGIDWGWWQEPAQPVPGRYLLGIGRLVPQKGFHVLIAAAGALRRRGVAISVVLAGDGDEKPRLEEQARGLGLTITTDLTPEAAITPGNVCFAGWVEGDRKRNMFAGASVVLFPFQVNEPFGIVMVEAMGAGKAIVATDTTANRAVLAPGRNAELVADSDPEHWAAALEHLLTDEAHRNHFERNNVTDARRFDWNIIAADYLNLYEGCLAAKP